jgi:hypothetical protein
MGGAFRNSDLRVDLRITLRSHCSVNLGLACHGRYTKTFVVILSMVFHGIFTARSYRAASKDDSKYGKPASFNGKLNRHLRGQGAPMGLCRSHCVAVCPYRRCASSQKRPCLRFETTWIENPVSAVELCLRGASSREQCCEVTNCLNVCSYSSQSAQTLVWVLPLAAACGLALELPTTTTA